MVGRVHGGSDESCMISGMEIPPKCTSLPVPHFAEDLVGGQPGWTLPRSFVSGINLVISP